MWVYCFYKSRLLDNFAAAAKEVESAATNFIQQHIPEAVLMESFGSELTYQLPDDVASIKKFDDLFTNLDKKLKELGISGYGISSSSLEEVQYSTRRINSAYDEIFLQYSLRTAALPMQLMQNE